MNDWNAVISVFEHGFRPACDPREPFDQRAGLSLWTREQLRTYRFPGLD